MSDIVNTFRSYALDKDNCPRMNTEVVYVRVGLLKEAADRIAQLEAALRDLIWYTNQLELTVYDPSDWPTEHDEVRNARSALEERT